MRNITIYIAILLLYSATYAQESIKIVDVPQVIIKDSLFYQMVLSVVNDAEKCHLTKELPCGVTCAKYELQNEYYIFMVEPFDVLILFVESAWGTNSWRITTINDVPVLFFFSDMDKFTNTNNTTQIIIDASQRIKYEYTICNDTVGLSKQSPTSLYLREEYRKEHGEYLLQYKSHCIDISGCEKRISKNRVLYIINE